MSYKPTKREVKAWMIVDGSASSFGLGACFATLSWTKERIDAAYRRGGYSKQYYVARVSIRQISKRQKRSER